jgi:putative ABC transport system permease protein
VTIADLLRFAAGALRGHGLRTVLCLTGVAVGVASVILLTALGEGARTYIIGEFRTLGSDLIVIFRGHTDTRGGPPIGGTPYDLTLDDAKAIQREEGRARLVAPLSMGTASVSRGNRNRDIPVVGTTAEFAEVRGLTMERGRFLPEGEWERGERLVVIGQTVREELFGEVNPLGRNLRIDEWRFKVIGVMAPRGESMGFNLDDLVMVPVATGLRIFNRRSLFRIFVQARSYEEIDAIRASLRELMIERHSGQEDVTIISQDAVLNSFSRILGVLTLALGGIAAVSLAVAGIGVMNVMLVSVSERTSEVGLLKALGVVRRQVLSVFLAEAAILSLAGGLAGLALGFALVRASVAFYPDLPAAPPAWAIVSVLGLSLLVGLVAGVGPARRAADLPPVEALGSRRGTA